MLNRLHPLVWVLMWVTLSVALMPVKGPPLWGFFALCLVVLWSFHTLIWQSIKRLKMLLFAMCLTHGWSIEGQALFDSYWSPTIDGLMLGLDSALHLMLSVIFVRILLRVLGSERILSSFWLVLRPLPKDLKHSIILRLYLCLRYAEQLLLDSERLGFNIKAWLNWTAPASQEEVELIIRPWRLFDTVILSVLMIVLLMLLKG